MNLDNLQKEKDQATVAAILKTVEQQFSGKDCQIWLSGVSQEDAAKAASQLRRDNLQWSFSVDPHGASGTYIVISQSRLAKSGEIGDH